MQSLRYASVTAGLVFLTTVLSAASSVAEIVSARYGDPTTRYAHGVLGDDIEYGSLILRLSDGGQAMISLPETRVFEDISPRLADVDSDGTPEVITVESDMSLGARLAIYDETGLVAATPFIGQSSRWLAPIGAADLDGDGFVEIAYIDRPHLAKTLRVWRFKDGGLQQVASKDGLTNHKIGWDYILGGIRNCADVPEIIVATGNWANIVTVRMKQEGRLTSRTIRRYTGPDSVNAELNCP